MEYKISKQGTSYWEGNGVYQTEYAELYKKYITNHEGPKTVMSEALRMANKVSVDYFDNCNRKAIDAVYGWDEEKNCYDVMDYKVSDDFDSALNYLNTFFNHFENDTGMETVQTIRNILQQTIGCKNADRMYEVESTEMDSYAYTRMMDEIIYTITNKEQHDIALFLWQ